MLLIAPPYPDSLVETNPRRPMARVEAVPQAAKARQGAKGATPRDRRDRRRRRAQDHLLVMKARTERRERRSSDAGSGPSLPSSPFMAQYIGQHSPGGERAAPAATGRADPVYRLTRALGRPAGKGEIISRKA